MNNLNDLSADELTQTSGGGFAFDAGRLIRFLSIQASYGGAAGVGTGMALIDLASNMVINEA